MINLAETKLEHADLSMLVIIRALVCFKVVHACVALLAEIAWEKMSVQKSTLHGAQECLQKNDFRASRALSVVASGSG